MFHELQHFFRFYLSRQVWIFEIFIFVMVKCFLDKILLYERLELVCKAMIFTDVFDREIQKLCDIS